jgi:hypothetical protein
MPSYVIIQYSAWSELRRSISGEEVLSAFGAYPRLSLSDCAMRRMTVPHTALMLVGKRYSLEFNSR